MPDNWNKLADLLGTPSIDPIERKASTPKPPPKAPSPPVAASPVNTDASFSDPIEATHADDPTTTQAEPPVAENKSKFKSTWDAVADFFGVGSTSKEESLPSEPAPVAQSHAPAQKSGRGFWPVADDDADSGRQASQKVSDEIFGKRNDARKPEDDLEVLLAGFKIRREETKDSPREATDHVPSVAARDSNARPDRGERAERPARGERTPRNDRAPRDDRPPRGERPAGRGERGPSRTPRDRDPDALDRRPPRPARDEFVEVGEEPSAVAPTRDARPTRGSQDRVRRTADAAFGESSETADRRGPRRRPRRELIAGEEPPAISDKIEDGASEVLDSDRTVDPSRRRGRRWDRDRAGRNDSPRVESDRDHGSARPEQPRRKTSAWEDPDLAVDVDEEEFGLAPVPLEEDDIDDEGQQKRRRRRRRRGPKAEGEESDDVVATTGRQIYGRHADESEDGLDEVEKLRSSNVVPWVDAISVIVDKNMKNHRHTPPHNSRGRSGGGGRGGNHGRRPPSDRPS